MTSFTAKLRPLAAALLDVNRITRRGGAGKPMNNNLRILTRTSEVWLSAVDVACSLHERIPAQVQDIGEVVTIGRNLENAMIDVVATDDETAKVTYDGHRLTLRYRRTSRKPGLGNDWVFGGCPTPDDFDGLTWMPLSKHFMRALSLASFAVADTFDPNHPWSSGVHVASDGDRLRLTGADGRRIAHVNRELESDAIDVVLDGRSLDLIRRTFCYGVDVEIAQTKGKAVLRQVQPDGRTIHIAVNQLESDYPDLTRAVVPPDHPHAAEMTLDKLKIPLTIVRAMLGSDARCIFEPRKDRLYLTAGDERCEVEYHLESSTTVSGPPIGFSVRYLRDPLDAIAAACQVRKIKSPVVRILWTGHDRPAAMECPDLPWVTQILGPMDPTKTRAA